jgi:chromosome segregation ATPase
VASNRASVEGLVRERGYWLKEAESLALELRSEQAKVAQLEERCKQHEAAIREVEAAWKEDRRNLGYELNRAKADLAEKLAQVSQLTEELAKLTDELVKEKKLAAGRKAANDGLREEQATEAKRKEQDLCEGGDSSVGAEARQPVERGSNSDCAEAAKSCSD